MLGAIINNKRAPFRFSNPHRSLHHRISHPTIMTMLPDRDLPWNSNMNTTRAVRNLTAVLIPFSYFLTQRRPRNTRFWLTPPPSIFYQRHLKLIDVAASCPRAGIALVELIASRATWQGPWMWGRAL